MTDMWTPGPWVLCRTTYNGETVGWHIAASPHGSVKPICEGLSEADGFLIAAAPDLFAAIRASDDAHWTPAMRAAMAKATEGASAKGVEQ